MIAVHCQRTPGEFEHPLYPGKEPCRDFHPLVSPSPTPCNRRLPGEI